MDEAVLNVIIKATDKATKVLDGVGSSFNNASSKLGAAGKRANDIGKSMTTKLTLPLLAAGGAAIKLGNDFNQSMANVATLIPGNTQRVGELKKVVQDMALETGKSTADLSDGLYNVVSAFGDTSDTATILELNAKAAAAGLAETTDAINLTSAVTKGYGDTTGAAVQKASDLALMTVRLGQTTFPELASSIGKVTPLAAGLNVTQEELFGTMATFTGVTGGAAEVSTQLRGVFQSLSAPTADMAGLLKEMGYESGAAAIEGEGLQGVMAAITKKAEETGQPLQKFISSIEGQTLAAAAAGGQADTYTEKLAAMGDVAGTTDVAFGEATSGVNKAGFEMAKARQEVEVMAQQLGDELAPYAIKVAKFVGRMAQKFKGLSPEAKKVVLIIGGLLAALGPALMIIGKVTQGIGLMAKGIGGVVKVLKLLSSGVAMAARAVGAAFTFMAAHPMILVFTLVVMAIAALVYIIIRNWDTLKAWFNTFWQFIQDIFKTAFDWIKSHWEILMIVLLGPLGAFVVAVIKNWDTIKSAAMAVFNFIKSFVTGVFNVLKAIVSAYLAVVTGVFNAIKAVVSAIFNVIKSIIRAYVNAWMAIIRTIIGVVRGIFSSALNVVKSVWGGVTGWFSGIVSGIGGAFSAVGSKITSPFKNAFNAVARFWNSTVAKLSFTVPDWVPGMGGKGFSMPTIPMLAAGGLVNKPTLAGIGEGGEAEAVIPMSRLERILDQHQERSLRAAGVVGNGSTVNNTNNRQVHIASVTLGSQGAVREFFEHLDNDTVMINKGFTPSRGGM